MSAALSKRRVRRTSTGKELRLVAKNGKPVEPAGSSVPAVSDFAADTAARMNRR